MKYFPYETFDIETQFKREEACLLVRRLISGTTSKYSGYMNENSFQIQRDIRCRNSFLPVIEGYFYLREGKTVVSIKMRLNQIVLVFMLVWMSLISVVLFVFLIQGLSKWEFNTANLIPAGMLLFGYVLTTLSFKIESKQSKIELKNLFRGNS